MVNWIRNFKRGMGGNRKRNALSRLCLNILKTGSFAVYIHALFGVWEMWFKFSEEKCFTWHFFFSLFFYFLYNIHTWHNICWYLTKMMNTLTCIYNIFLNQRTNLYHRMEIGTLPHCFLVHGIKQHYWVKSKVNKQTPNWKYVNEWADLLCMTPVSERVMSGGEKKNTFSDADASRLDCFHVSIFSGGTDDRGFERLCDRRQGKPLLLQKARYNAWSC